MLQRVTYRMGDKGLVLAMQQQQVWREREKLQHGEGRAVGRGGWRRHHLRTKPADCNLLVGGGKINLPDLS